MDPTVIILHPILKPIKKLSSNLFSSTHTHICNIRFTAHHHQHIRNPSTLRGCNLAIRTHTHGKTPSSHTHLITCSLNHLTHAHANPPRVTSPKTHDATLHGESLIENFGIDGYSLVVQKKKKLTWH